MRYFYTILALVVFCIGGLIYVIYRSLTLQMFVWFKHLGLYPLIITFRYRNWPVLPDWVVYSLPDGLWMLSYLLIMKVIWYKKATKQALVLPLILPCFMNLTEILQAINYFPGTFDYLDLICYNIPVIIYLILYAYERKTSFNNLRSCNGTFLDNSGRIG